MDGTTLSFKKLDSDEMMKLEGKGPHAGGTRHCEYIM